MFENSCCNSGLLLKHKCCYGILVLWSESCHASLKLGKCWACWRAGRWSFSTCTSFKLNPDCSAVLWTWEEPFSFSGCADPTGFALSFRNLPWIAALAGTLGAIPNCEKHFKILFIYTHSNLPFSFHMLITKNALNISWRWDLLIYLNFVLVVDVFFFFNIPHFALSVGKCESYYGNKEWDDFLLS